MPDNLIIAPDGLVKVEPARCAFCCLVLRTRRVATVLCDWAYVRRSECGNATPVRTGLMSIPTARA